MPFFTFLQDAALLAEKMRGGTACRPFCKGFKVVIEMGQGEGRGPALRLIGEKTLTLHGDMGEEA